LISAADRFWLGRTKEDVFVALLWAVLIAAILHAARVLFLGLWQPLLDYYGFRQTQTALTVYWLLHGGPWIAYETPVLGAPWSMPMEFPLYQWFVALLAKTGVPIDAAGRLVSFFFYVATLWPLAKIFRAIKLGRIAFLCTAILFMNAPLYVYWSRAFLIESCALFFSTLAVALVAEYLARERFLIALTAGIAGCAAVLTKVTTFPAFAFVAGSFILIQIGIRMYTAPSLSHVKTALIAGLSITLPFVVGYVWVAYSDQVKLANAFGPLMTSTYLWGWHFGNMEERLSSFLWIEVIQKRALADLFGPAALVAVLAAGAAFSRPRFAMASGVAMIAFLLGFLVFTHVHIVHTYYQYANGIFALAAAGIGIGGMVENRRDFQYGLAAVVLGALLPAQLVQFRAAYALQVTQDYSQHRLRKVAEILRDNTSPNSSFIVIGDDWSSTIPYYSERKGLALAPYIPKALTEKILANPQSFLGDRPFAAIVVCLDQIATYKESAPLIETFIADKALIGEFGGCQVLRG